jgi:thiol-disulfide isomerase/thioredoxin
MRFRNIVWAMLWPSFSVFAQNPLAIGDRLPEVQMENMINYPATTAKLSDFKGKLLLIDFWATWCTSCLHNFPKLDSLQSALGPEFKVLLINSKPTRDDASKLRTFFNKWESRTGKKLGLATTVSDTIMDHLLPHRLLPHYVWVDENRKVIAITSSEAVTTDNVKAVLQGQHLDFREKKDQDAERPIFSSGDLPVDRLLNYSVFLKGWYEGLPSGSRLRRSGDRICGRAVINTAILEMYKIVARGIYPDFNPRKLVVEVKDSSELFSPREVEREDWNRAHAYSMDVIVPMEDAAHLYERMLDVLNLYSGFSGHFYKRNDKTIFVVSKK